MLPVVLSGFSDVACGVIIDIIDNLSKFLILPVVLSGFYDFT